MLSFREIVSFLHIGLFFSVPMLLFRIFLKTTDFLFYRRETGGKAPSLPFAGLSCLMIGFLFAVDGFCKSAVWSLVRLRAGSSLTLKDFLSRVALVIGLWLLCLALHPAFLLSEARLEKKALAAHGIDGALPRRIAVRNLILTFCFEGALIAAAFVFSLFVMANHIEAMAYYTEPAGIVFVALVLIAFAVMVFLKLRFIAKCRKERAPGASADPTPKTASTPASLI